MSARLATNDLEAFWMPFTANRQYKRSPRLVVSAEGMHYTTDDGRKVLDGTSGLWCVNAGHCRSKIVEAIRKQVGELDFAGTFQMGHPRAFECASKLVNIAPPGFDHVFFTNSGSESVETALKIALAYHRAKGNATKTRLIGRERGYHGVNFGGTSVGGILNNRKMFGTLLSGVDHIRHTHDLGRNAFSRGEPEHGAELADDLERLVALHDASTIAAVIVEPVACSTGVLIPPKGYLKRLAAICAKHDILLIFDEVITAFGRLGTSFGADYFGVSPDIITTAKGITNGTIPMGAVFVTTKIHDAFMNGPEEVIDFFHGYTYSGHPVACAASKKATVDWGTTPPLKRIKHMFRFKELLDRNADEIARTISKEHGKTHADAAGELARGIDVVDFACGIPHFLKGEYSRNVGPEIDSWSDRQPLGVVAGITPFNFPAMVPMWMYPVAIACGN